VFLDRAWIAGAAGGDLGQSCAPPRALEPGTTVYFDDGPRLLAGESVFYEFPIPPGTAQLRVAVNAEASAGIDLFLRHGAVPVPNAFDCSSENPAFLPEFCVIQNPAPGTWYALARAFEGSGTFQLVATLLDAPSTSGPCVPNAETACLQGGRFEVKIGWSNSSGSGTGSVMSFGGQRAENNDSAFYSFQSPTNFEMGVKMLNACIPLFGNKFWVFVSGLTDQGWQVTVRDTQTGATKTYSNTQGNLSETFADTSAFDC
jgi:hypothetical protein